MSRLRVYQRDETYRVYSSDMLKAMTESMGKSVSMRYSELFEKRDERSGDEIAADVLTRMGVVVE